MIDKQIELDPLPTDLSDEEVRKIFRRLRTLMVQHGDLNQHELVIIMIGACIMEGCNVGKRITGTLGSLGFNKQHVGKMLSDGSGDDPRRHYWRRNSLGTYEMLEATLPESAQTGSGLAHSTMSRPQARPHVSFRGQ